MKQKPRPRLKGKQLDDYLFADAVIIAGMGRKAAHDDPLAHWCGIFCIVDRLNRRAGRRALQGSRPGLNARPVSATASDGGAGGEGDPNRIA